MVRLITLKRYQEHDIADLDKEFGTLDIGDQGHSTVHSHPPCPVALGQHCGDAPGTTAAHGQVHHKVEALLLQEVRDTALLPFRALLSGVMERPYHGLNLKTGGPPLASHEGLTSKKLYRGNLVTRDAIYRDLHYRIIKIMCDIMYFQDLGARCCCCSFRFDVHLFVYPQDLYVCCA